MIEVMQHPRTACFFQKNKQGCILTLIVHNMKFLWQPHVLFMMSSPFTVFCLQKKLLLFLPVAITSNGHQTLRKWEKQHTRALNREWNKKPGTKTRLDKEVSTFLSVSVSWLWNKWIKEKEKMEKKMKKKKKPDH